MTITHVISIAAIIVSALGVISGMQGRANKRLRKRLNQAIRDNRAFWHLEARYCAELSVKNGETLRGVKLRVREEQRTAKQETPSPYSTPKRIEDDLLKYAA